MVSLITDTPVLSNPTSSDTLNSVTTALKHATQHSNANDWIEAFAAYLKGGELPQVHVYNNANISLAVNATTYLTFNTERSDTQTMHSTVSNTGRLTAPIDGVYLIWGSVWIASDANGYRALTIRLNGTTGIASIQVPAVNGASTRLCVTALYSLSATHYVELGAWQNNGVGALNALAQGNESPEFGMVRLA